MAASGLQAQVAWTEINPATTPLTRKYTTMVWDSVRERVVLFGGQQDLDNYFDDTWEWDGQRWHELAPAHRPTPPREDHMMAFDRRRGRAVVFGGHDINVLFLNDTWEWDGTDWHATTPTKRPPPLAYSAMAYDQRRGVVVLFGGLDQARVVTDETWEWDGTNWTKHKPLIHPPARSHHAMTFDPAEQRIVLYGGEGRGWYNDQWHWDGTVWIDVTTTPPGPALNDTRMVYDTHRDRLVLWGGRFQPNDQAWELEGDVWLTRQLAQPAPPARQAHTMAFDEVRGEVVLFGGWDGTQIFGDTWIYGPVHPARNAAFGASCGAPPPGLHLDPQDALPWLQSTARWVVEPTPPGAPAVLLVGASRTHSSLGQLPFDLARFGLPGCLLLGSGDLALPMVSVHRHASTALTVPSVPQLADHTVWCQALVGDPAANVLGFAFTNGLGLTFGGR